MSKAQRESQCTMGRVLLSADGEQSSYALQTRSRSDVYTTDLWHVQTAAFTSSQPRLGSFASLRVAAFVDFAARTNSADRAVRSIHLTTDTVSSVVCPSRLFCSYKQSQSCSGIEKRIRPWQKAPSHSVIDVRGTKLPLGSDHKSMHAGKWAKWFWMRDHYSTVAQQ